MIYGSGNISSPITALTLTSNQGFVIQGLFDSLLISSAAAGDVNGDGYSDIVVGGYDSSDAGAAYVIYGRPILLESSILGASSLSKTNGFIVNVNADNSPATVANAGDVNGDGIEDIIAGVVVTDFSYNDNRYTYVGTTYVIYGGYALLESAFVNVTALNGINGFIGAVASDSAKLIAGAGDLNGDGKADIIIGAPGVNAVYLRYGENQSCIIQGPYSNGFGLSIASAGDVNGDGKSDIIIGAPNTQNGAGAAYVIYGNSNMPATIIASMLKINEGFIINGTASAYLGFSVASAGDVNGDDIADIIIGGGCANNIDGNVYVIYGGKNIISPIVESSLVGIGKQGFIIQGVACLGYSVASAGDRNGDNIEDIIVGSPYEGVAYVIYGSKNIISPIRLSSFTSSQGFLINCPVGILMSVASAADINGNGIADVILSNYDDGRCEGSSCNGGMYIARVIYSMPSFLKRSFLDIALLSSADGFIINGTASAYLGFSVASAGDVNGDNITDIIVGSQNGFAYVIYGSKHAISSITTSFPMNNSQGFVVQGDIGSGFGYLVASLGDVNGDSIADVIIGSTAAAYVIYGGRHIISPITASSQISNNQGFIIQAYVKSAASIGDVNDDNITDIIVGDGNSAYIIYGGKNIVSPIKTSSLGNQGFVIQGVANSGFGTSVANAGDVNNDGESDIIVGAPSAQIVYVIYGSKNTLSSITTSSLTSSQGFVIQSSVSDFGTLVAKAGDMNGDGYSDIIVRASTTSYLIYGMPSLLKRSFLDIGFFNGFIVNGNAGSSLGSSVSAGDVNGDGISDVIIGASSAAYVIYGGRSISSRITASFLTSSQGFMIQGSVFSIDAVANAGDVNGDGFNDVIVGISSTNNAAGAAYVIYGSRNIISPITLSSISGNKGFMISNQDMTYRSLGAVVANAGDINGDGQSDIIVGAYAVNSGARSVYVIYGSKNIISQFDISTLSGGKGFMILNQGANYRFAVASAGDVNGDRYSDIVLGAPGTDEYGFTDTVYVIYGSNNAISPITASSMNNSQGFMIRGVAGSGFGTSVASAGDINGDNIADIIVRTSINAIYVIYGSNHTNTPITVSSMTNDQGFMIQGVAGSVLSTSISSAGDINGDGINDIVISGLPSNTGVVIIYGSRHIISPIIISSMTSSQGFVIQGINSIGIPVSNAGDTNGDGVSDIIVGAYNANTVYVIYGKPVLSEGAFMVHNGTNAIETQIVSASSAGDVNGDNYSDIIVGVRYGAAYVIYGSRNLSFPITVSSLTSDKGFVINGNTSSNFGTSVAGAGDINGDGMSDIIVGASGANNGAGAAYVIYGTPILSETPFVDVTSLKSSSGIIFKSSYLYLASAGDINSDGKGDIIAGVANGRVITAYLIYGGRSVSSPITASYLANNNDFIIGDFTALANAGDVNGDGHSDIIVISPSGEVYVLYSSFQSATSTATVTTIPTASATSTTTSASTPSSTPSSSSTDTGSGTFTPSNSDTNSMSETLSSSTTETRSQACSMTSSVTITATPSVSTTTPATKTVKQSNTPSSTGTTTARVTSTSSNSVTNSMSATPSSSVTSTSSQTASATGSATVTSVPTISTTSTATGTISNTPSASLTNSVSATPSVSPTSTSSQISSATSSITVTTMPTASVTSTATGTPTSSNTASISSTATPSKTFTPSGSVTSSITPSNTVTDSASSTNTGTSSRTGSISIIATTSPTSTHTPNVSLTETFSVFHTPTLSVTRSITTTVSTSGSVTESATGSITRKKLRQTPTPTTTATESPTQSPTASLSYGGSITGAIETVSGTQTLTNSNSATKSISTTPSVSITVTQTPSAIYTYTPSSTSTTSKTGTRSTVETFTPTASVTATASVTDTPSTSESRSFTRTLSITHSLTGSVTASVTQSLTASPSATKTTSVTSILTNTPSSTSSTTPTVSGTYTSSITSTYTPSSTRTISNTWTTSTTDTFTPTLSSSPSSTTSNSPTPTESMTPTLTSSATASLTRQAIVLQKTRSSTITDTPSMTQSPTASPSATYTRTATGSLTNSDSLTEATTPTISATETPSVTHTYTSSSTSTTSDTETTSISTSAMTTLTPTTSTTATKTATVTHTSIPTKTLTLSSSISSSNSMTPTESISQSLSRSAMVSVTHKTKVWTLTPTATGTGSTTTSQAITPSVKGTSTATQSFTNTLTDSVSMTSSSTTSATFTETNEATQSLTTSNTEYIAHKAGISNKTKTSTSTETPSTTQSQTEKHTAETLENILKLAETINIIEINGDGDFYGTKGRDNFIVTSPAKNVFLTGDEGIDRFTIRPSDNSRIIINDFEDGEIIDFSAFFGILLLEDLNMTFGSTIMHLPSNQTVIVKNKNPEYFDKSKFVFHNSTTAKHDIEERWHLGIGAIAGIAGGALGAVCAGMGIYFAIKKCCLAGQVQDNYHKSVIEIEP